MSHNNETIPLPTIPALLGRSSAFPDQRKIQLFASYAAFAGAIVEPENVPTNEGWATGDVPMFAPPCPDGDVRKQCERLWRIGTSALVAFRESEGGAAPLSIDELETFQQPNATTPAAAVTGGDGYFRLRVALKGMAGDTVFWMDCNQSVECYCFRPTIDVFGPSNTILITPQNDARSGSPAELSGRLVDARIGANMKAIEAPTGLRHVQFTQFVRVAASASVLVSVPPFAVGVKIYQDSAGAASGPWTRMMGTAGGGLAVGEIAFTGRASRNEDFELGRESGLLTDINEINDRLFQVVWRIRPL